MSKLLLINLIMAFTWLFLSEQPSIYAWLGGIVIGWLIIVLLTRDLSGHIYFRAPVTFLRLLLVFIKELIVANLTVAAIVLSPRIKVEPGFIAYPLQVNQNWQITLLTSLITLTPGTLSVDVSADRKYLLIHVLHVDDSAKIKDSIYNSFEKYILEVSRS